MCEPNQIVVNKATETIIKIKKKLKALSTTEPYSFYLQIKIPAFLSYGWRKCTSDDNIYLLQKGLKCKTVFHLQVGFQAFYNIILVVYYLIERLAFVDYLSVECHYVKKKLGEKLGDKLRKQNN